MEDKEHVHYESYCQSEIYIRWAESIYLKGRQTCQTSRVPLSITEHTIEEQFAFRVNPFSFSKEYSVQERREEVPLNTFSFNLAVS